MLEAKCGKCGETFNPNDTNDLEHIQTYAEAECGGRGPITGFDINGARQLVVADVQKMFPNWTAQQCIDAVMDAADWEGIAEVDPLLGAAYRMVLGPDGGIKWQLGWR